MHRAIVWIGPAMLVAACSATPAGTQPTDMSADEHRQHARSDESQARAHEAQYDPAAEETMPVGNPADPDSYAYGPSYNPTERHLADAEEHRAHARAHRAAAEALEQFEQKECAKFPPKTRAACPLLAQIRAVEKTANGVRISLAEGANREAIVAHMRCHLAFAAAHGFEGMDACPLYVKGASIQEVDGAVLLEAPDSTAAYEIQRRTANHVE